MIRRPPRSTLFPTRRSSDLILGILPGGGAVIASFAAYTFEKKIAKDPSRFGRDGSLAIFFSNRSEEHTSELQSHLNLVCRLLLEKKKIRPKTQEALTSSALR